jgi:hypothetical protein
MTHVQSRPIPTRFHPGSSGEAETELTRVASNGADVLGAAPTDTLAKRVFIGLAVLGVLTVLPRVGGWSDASRMGTIQGLIDFHSFSIDKTAFLRTGDKVFVNGHFYSHQLAGPALLGAIVYWPLSLLGLKLAYGWNIAYYVITLLTVKASWFAGLVAFYKSLGFTPLAERKRVWLMLALGVGSLYFTWSATFNNHSLAASWVAIGFYFMLRAHHGHRVGVSLFLSGLFFAQVGGSDVPVLAVFGGFSCTSWRTPNSRFRWPSFRPCSSITGSRAASSPCSWSLSTSSGRAPRGGPRFSPALG